MTTISNCLPGTSLICFLRVFFFFSFLEIFLVLSFESLVLSCCLTSCLYELDKTAVSQSWGSSLLQTRPPCGLAACDGWFGQPGGRRGVPKVSGALACGEAGCVYKCHGDSSCSFRSRLKWAWATRPGTQRDSLAGGQARPDTALPTPWRGRGAEPRPRDTSVPRAPWPAAHQPPSCSPYEVRARALCAGRSRRELGGVEASGVGGSGSGRAARACGDGSLSSRPPCSEAEGSGRAAAQAPC